MTSTRSIGRNDPCPCGSGKKYKQCCLGHAGRMGVAAWVGIVALVAAAVLAAALLLNLATGRGVETTRECPPGEVWSEAHGHCHVPGS